MTRGLGLFNIVINDSIFNHLLMSANREATGGGCDGVFIEGVLKCGLQAR